jgi:hypothetical protein
LRPAAAQLSGQREMPGAVRDRPSLDSDFSSEEDRF